MYTNANITILCHATIFLSAGFPQLLSSLPTSYCHSALHRTASSSPSSSCAVLSGLRKIRAAVKGGVQQYLYTIHATSKYPLTGAGVTTDGVIDGTVSGWEVPVCPLCAAPARCPAGHHLPNSLHCQLSPPCLPSTGDSAVVLRWQDARALTLTFWLFCAQSLNFGTRSIETFPFILTEKSSICRLFW